MLVGAWGLFMLVAPDAQTARSSLQAEPQGPERAQFVISAPAPFDLSALLPGFQTTMNTRIDVAQPGTAILPNADVVLVDGTTLASLIRQDQVQPIDLRRVANAQSLGPQILQWASAYDSASSFGVPVFWEALALKVAPDRLVSRIENPIAPNSLSVLFQPEIADDLMGCGLAVQAEPAAAFSAALIYLGIDPAQATPQQVEQAANLLEVNGSVLQFREASDGDVREPCVKVGFFSGYEYFQAETALALPREGTALTMYFLAIPKTSSVPDQATAFIDHVLGSPDLAVVAQSLDVNTTVLMSNGRHPDATERMLVALNRARVWPPAPDQQAGLKTRRWRLITSNAGSDETDPGP